MTTSEKQKITKGEFSDRLKKQLETIQTFITMAREIILPYMYTVEGTNRHAPATILVHKQHEICEASSLCDIEMQYPLPDPDKGIVSIRWGKEGKNHSPKEDLKIAYTPSRNSCEFELMLHVRTQQSDEKEDPCSIGGWIIEEYRSGRWQQWVNATALEQITLKYKEEEERRQREEVENSIGLKERAIAKKLDISLD